MNRPIKFRAWKEGKYEIGSDGSIWSTDFNNSGKRKRMHDYPDKDGYRMIFFTIKGKRRAWGVHRLVAWAFHGEKPTPKHQVNHKNGKRNDNRAENLEYLTSRENTIHGWKRGRTVSERHRANGREQMRKINSIKWPKHAAA